jgi:hypothetical protein
MTGRLKSGDPRRAERLKAALRDNLKRRKAQLKGRAQVAADTEGQDSALPSAHTRRSGDSGR